MKQTIIEILKEYGGQITITDFDIAYQGALITDVVLTADEEIQIWAGDPITDKHSEEILVNDETREMIYSIINEEF